MWRCNMKKFRKKHPAKRKESSREWPIEKKNQKPKRGYPCEEGDSQGRGSSRFRGPTVETMKIGPWRPFPKVTVDLIQSRRKELTRTRIKIWEDTSYPGGAFPSTLANKGESSAMQQGKEGSVGSNTQESHQYVGPYRLEKTLGKGQTGMCLENPFILLMVIILMICYYRVVRSGMNRKIFGVLVIGDCLCNQDDKDHVA